MPKSEVLATRVSEQTHWRVKRTAAVLGMSVSEYLKLLIYRELGEAPSGSIPELKRWLKGK